MHGQAADVAKGNNALMTYHDIYHLLIKLLITALSRCLLLPGAPRQTGRQDIFGESPDLDSG